MGTIANLKRRIETLDIDRVITSSFGNTIEQLADENAVQLSKGETSRDGNFRSYRNPEYATMKNRMNPVPGFGNPDLKLTGSFYHGIYARVEGTKIVIDSTDPKTDDLKKKYGDKYIFGLNNKSRSEYLREFLRPQVARQLEEAIGLNF